MWKQLSGAGGSNARQGLTVVCADMIMVGSADIMQYNPETGGNQHHIHIFNPFSLQVCTYYIVSATPTLPHQFVDCHMIVRNEWQQACHMTDVLCL